eukprot:jgi/Tetstr1/454046/TSEL_040965.t1
MSGTESVREWMARAVRDAGVLAAWQDARSHLLAAENRSRGRHMMLFRTPIRQKNPGSPRGCTVDREGDLVVGFKNTGASGKIVEVDVSVGGALVCTAAVPPGACVAPLLDAYPIPQISLRFHEVRMVCRYRDEGRSADAVDELEIVYALVDSQSRRDMCTTPWVMGKIGVTSGMMNAAAETSAPCNTPEIGDAVRTLRFSLPSPEIYIRGDVVNAPTLGYAVVDAFCRGSVNVVRDLFSAKWCDSKLSAMTQFLSDNPGHKGLIDMDRAIPGLVAKMTSSILCRGATVCAQAAFVRYEGRRTAPAHRDGSLAGGAVTVLVYLTDSPGELTVFPRWLEDEDDDDRTRAVVCSKGTAVCFGVDTMHYGKIRPEAAGPRKAVLAFEVAFG